MKMVPGEVLSNYVCIVVILLCIVESSVMLPDNSNGMTAMSGIDI